MSIKRLLDAVERRGYIGWRVAALVLPVAHRARVTSSCSGKVRLREAGKHPSGSNLASRNNVAHGLPPDDPRMVWFKQALCVADPASAPQQASIAFSGSGQHSAKHREVHIATGEDQADTFALHAVALLEQCR